VGNAHSGAKVPGKPWKKTSGVKFCCQGMAAHFFLRMQRNILAGKSRVITGRWSIAGGRGDNHFIKKTGPKFDLASEGSVTIDPAGKAVVGSCGDNEQAHRFGQ